MLTVYPHYGWWFRNPFPTTWDGAIHLVNNGISTTVPSTGELAGFLPTINSMLWRKEFTCQILWVSHIDHPTAEQQRVLEDKAASNKRFRWSLMNFWHMQQAEKKYVTFGRGIFNCMIYGTVACLWYWCKWWLGPFNRWWRRIMMIMTTILMLMICLRYDKIALAN